jgi:hypothetical protein
MTRLTTNLSIFSSFVIDPRDERAIRRRISSQSPQMRGAPARHASGGLAPSVPRR